MWAQERDTTSPTPEGTLFATAFGINARDDVVGTFVDKNFVQHGSLLSKGEFTVIDFRDDQGTVAEAPSHAASVPAAILSRRDQIHISGLEQP